MTLPADSQPGPYQILAPVGAGRTEDVTQPITVVVGWAPEAKR